MKVFGRTSLKRIRKKARGSSLFRKFVIGSLILFPLVLIAGGASLYWIIRDLPDIYSLKDYRPSITTRIYADDNNLLHEFFMEDRRVISISKVPKYVINAFVAAEDSRFFEHEGVDLYGIVRAFVKNLEHGAIVQGGSTITQQVAKSFFLTSEKTYGRKIKEVILAHRINNYLKKYEILNLYLNQIYLGHGTYGIEAASRYYFAKSAREITLAEAAMLAGLPKAPSKYSPFVSSEKAYQRQAYVLTRMVEDGYITEEEKERIIKTPVRLNKEGAKAKIAPYFTENIRRYILANYGSDVLYKEGLDIYTTLNINAQRAAEAAVERGLQELEKREGLKTPMRRIHKGAYKSFLEELDRGLEARPLERGQVVKALVEKNDAEAKVLHLKVGTARAGMADYDDIVLEPAARGAGKTPATSFQPGDVVYARVIDGGSELRLAIEMGRTVQAALLCMDARNGEIKAMVGGRDFNKSEYNRTTQARRQPGSAFKPIIYSAALDKGMTPATIIVDEPISFDTPAGEWKPQNFDRQYWGPTTLRSALVHSRNVVTIKILQEIGVNYAADYAANMGITSPVSKNLSLALGTSGVTVQELVRAFGVLANEGRRVEPFYIRKIVDRTGNVFEEHKPVVEQVIDPKVAYLTTSILQDVVLRGTGWRVKSLGRPAAGKTGTTDDLKDAWFVGYTPSIVAGVWVGYDDGKPLGKAEVGGMAAAPIWLYFMERAVQQLPAESFPMPEGVISVKIDPKTGLLAKPGASNTINEVFLSGSAPADYSANPVENRVLKFFLGTPDQKKTENRGDDPPDGKPR
ncbi:MAG: PBP1A family penicillin-binding protein [Syntrophales bacterium]|nr:PBP1A family penicillin-binding protein [Syntrophales bacterium]MDD5232585.1 PBP1A family penicillin-binding protein [Syntrophales bacterium]MDD5531297.1 PBP1A family penicillin-binding protein [Syntrophales bacterium]